MKDNKKMEIPVSIRMREATQEIVENMNEISNKYQLPLYLLDKIILDIHQEIQNEMLKEEQGYYEKINSENERKSDK